jgi:tetratricopeptide (TPR) repeat protein
MAQRRLAALLLILLCTVISPCATAAAAQDWDAGRQAFAAGDFSSALLFFEMSRDAGLQGPAVHYNIAVCQFELGQYEDARRTFGHISANYPEMRGLAQYNMGLAQRRLGNAGKARQHFINAWEVSADDEKLRSLSAAMLEELVPDDPPDWYGAFALRFGHDDNVALRDSLGLPAGVTSESPMLDAFASLSGTPPGLGAVLLDASVYAIAYADADDFDQTEVRLGGLYTAAPGDWWLEAGVHFVYGTLGGSDFEREIAVSARAVRHLHDASSIDAQFRYDKIDELDALFAGIAGSRQRLDLRYRLDLASHTFMFRYGIETNDRADAAVSPSRTALHADYRFQPVSGWGLEAGISFRASEYDDLETPRTEDLTTFTAALTRTVADAWLFALQYQYSDNDSGDPAFSYERNLVTLGVLRSF